jgi:hypothetical protein
MNNYNQVKDLVLNKLIEENLIDREDAEEFRDRCQVLVYKGSWFSKWFDNNMKPKGSDKNGYFMRIIEMSKKEDKLERLMRRTTGDYNE